MKALSPYLNFAPGKSREALGFYQRALKAEIESLQTFGDAKQGTPPEMDGEVMHAVIRVGGYKIMASAGNPKDPVRPGNNVSLTLECDDAAEQDAFWKGLSGGAQIGMPLQDTFWGARFGLLTDKYGINWMLNWQKGG